MKRAGWWKEYLPAAGMVEIQVTAAAMTLLNRAALVKGMSPRVFIFYRQATATLFIFPLLLFSSRRKGTEWSIGMRSFLLIFTLSIIGVTLNQNLYFEGLYLASSSIASAMSNLVPAVTFLIASLFGLERVNIRSWSSRAKILGTVTCVGGAVSITFLKGPKLLGAAATWLHHDLPPVQDAWLLGCLFLFANSITWSLWLILQVPATASCPDHLCISAWTCLLSTMQSGLVALLFEPAGWETWNMSSPLELSCIFLSGIMGSGVQYIIQAWCISSRGPLYSAMFNPLCTVIVTVLAAIFMHEHIFIGSLMGSAAVIVGLYVVLWGKSKEIIQDTNNIVVEEDNVNVIPTHSKEIEDSLEQPLLPQP
ncbi:hypothetical protein V2J09_018867 [Rumex salicifolius]